MCWVSLFRVIALEGMDRREWRRGEEVVATRKVAWENGKNCPFNQRHTYRNDVIVCSMTYWCCVLTWTVVPLLSEIPADIASIVIPQVRRRKSPPSLTFVFLVWVEMSTLPDKYRAVNKTDVIEIRRNTQSDFNPEPTTICRV